MSATIFYMRSEILAYLQTIPLPELLNCKPVDISHDCPPYSEHKAQVVAEMLEELYLQGDLVNNWNASTGTFLMANYYSIADLRQAGFPLSYLLQHRKALAKALKCHETILPLVDAMRKRGLAITSLLEHPRGILLIESASLVTKALERGIDFAFFAQADTDTIELFMLSEAHAPRLKQTAGGEVATT